MARYVIWVWYFVDSCSYILLRPLFLEEVGCTDVARALERIVCGLTDIVKYQNVANKAYIIAYKVQSFHWQITGKTCFCKWVLTLCKHACVVIIMSSRLLKQNVHTYKSGSSYLKLHSFNLVMIVSLRSHLTVNTVAVTVAIWTYLFDKIFQFSLLSWGYCTLCCSDM